jgi:hypothetical protein
MLFANFLNFAIFWNSEAFNQTLVRVVNVPALAIINNIILTDWYLLPAHSVFFTLICTIYRLYKLFLTDFALIDLGMVLALAVG